MALRDLTLLPMAPVALDPDRRAEVDVYRPFFLAGILCVLTAGCALGALALLGIAQQGSYVASFWTPYVLAHANSQLYGWVGFFVMGFALQQHAPRHSRLGLFQTLAKVSLLLMALGIALRFVAEPMVKVEPSFRMQLGIGSCLLQTVAVALFMVNTAVTRYRTGKSLSWQTKFVFTSLAWWMLVAIAEPIAFVGSHRPGMSGIAFVAEWFPAYREAQFLGFVTMMVFGVALVKMNSCFGARPAHRLWGELGFVLWTAGLVLRMAGWVGGYRAGLGEGSLLGYHLGGLMLALGAVSLVIASRMFEPVSKPYSSHKFVRAALGWLVVAALMLVLEPIHLSSLGAPFSHAYTGAVRHAVTVGFISQMILGVGLHVASRMNSVADSEVPQLWSVFWLLNIGNALRVTCEVATDWTPAAFTPMGFTGFVELLALCAWASTMVRTMVRGRMRVASL